MKDIRISRFFTKSFLGETFDEKRYKEEYRALYRYLGVSVVRLGTFNSDKPIDEKDVKEAMGEILGQVEKNARKLFNYYGVKFENGYAYGGLNDKEKEDIEKDVYKRVVKPVSKSPKKPEIVNEFLNAKKYEAEFIKAIKDDKVLKNLDLSVFGEVLKIARYTKGKLDSDTRKSIIEYVRSFSTAKKGYLYDSTYFYIERSSYKGGNVFEDIENEYKSKDVGAYYNMIAYYVDYFYDLYAFTMALEREKNKKKKGGGNTNVKKGLSEKLVGDVRAKNEIKREARSEDTTLEKMLKKDSATKEQTKDAQKETKSELKSKEATKKTPTREIGLTRTR